MGDYSNLERLESELCVWFWYSVNSVANNLWLCYLTRYRKGIIKLVSTAYF